jgi:hypothetical protein
MTSTAAPLTSVPVSPAGPTSLSPGAVRMPLTTTQAVALKDRMRADGWQPLEDVQKFLNKPLGAKLIGNTLTIVHVPEFKSLLKGARSWYQHGIVDPPAEAVFPETYVVAGDDTTARYVCA